MCLIVVQQLLYSVLVAFIGGEGHDLFFIEGKGYSVNSCDLVLNIVFDCLNITVTCRFVVGVMKDRIARRTIDSY